MVPTDPGDGRTDAAFPIHYRHHPSFVKDLFSFASYSAANGSDYDVLGCARPDASPPLDQPSAVKIEIEGNSCDPTYDDGTSTCNETVKEARYRITIDKNGWIKKVPIVMIETLVIQF